MATADDSTNVKSHTTHPDKISIEIIKLKKKKKPRRNFRERRQDSESDDENHSDKTKEKTLHKDSGSTGSNSASSNSLSKASSQAKTKPFPKVPSTNSILSFENDEVEGGEVFQIKKPVHSKRIVKQLKKEKQKETEDGPTFSVKQNAAKPKINGNSERKPEKTIEAVVENLDNYGSDESYENSDDEKKDKGPSVQDILKSGVIPDANMIHLARKRRQQAREMGGDDFIRVDDTVRCEKTSSRLIRDDDNDASDSDGDQESLALTLKQKEAERRKLEERILAAEEESHSDASDQERKWEEQQIRKGVSIPAQQVQVLPSASTAAGSGSDYYYDGYQQSFVFGPSGFSYGVGANCDQTSAFSRMMGSAKNFTPGIVNSTEKKLADRLSELVDLHRAHVNNRDDLSSRIDLTRLSIDDLRNKTGGLEEQYKFFQEMRGYVKDLVECMNEKMSSINFLERCMLQLWKQRSEKLMKRRQEDIKDQSFEYTAGKAQITDDNAEANARKRRRAEREGRRTRRKRTREMQGVRDHIDGMSTDDEVINSEIAKFKSEQERIAGDCATAFDDVVEDFCDYSKMKARFEKWKTDYSDSYNEAYIGLCLTKLFTPLIKLELIPWNPLEPNCVDFEESRWYKSLSFYGFRVEPEIGNGDDPDLKLLPNIVDKILIPKLSVLVETVWDPLSLQQTTRLTKLVRRLIDDYPTVNHESKNTQALMKAIVQRIRKSLDDDVFMPLYPKTIIENRLSEPSIFFYRQFYSCVKLCTSIMLWQKIISDRHLQTMMLDSLLNRYMIIALSNSPISSETISMCQMVSSLVPKDWFSDCDPESSLSQFDNFCRFLVTTAITLSNQLNTNRAAKDWIKQISKILVQVHAMKHAVKVGGMVGYKIVPE